MRILYHPKKIVAPTSCVEYGLLYNWWAATDVRNVANTGWHVPSFTEISTLETYLGGSTISGGKIKETGLIYWNSPNTGATNEVGFNGRGSGKRSSSGAFSSLRTGLGLGSSTQQDTSNWKVRSVASYNSTGASGLFDNKHAGWSLRFIKDATTLSNGQTGTYTGNDGRVYRTICIGTQEWLADNLMETQFRNGDIIPWYGANPASYFTNAEWAALTTAGMCAYNNDVSYVGCDFSFPAVEYVNVNYGYLYNWYAVTDVRGLASAGWHVSTDAEASALSSYLGGASVAGGKLKETGTTYWTNPNIGATNQVSFNARGGGWRSKSSITGLAVFAFFKAVSYWWTSSLYDSLNAWTYSMYYDYSDNYRSSQPKLDGNYVRLVKDSTTLSHGQTGIYIGNDGRIYRTICINNKEWLADNLVETKYSNGDWISGFDGGVYTPISASAWVLLTTGAMCAYGDDQTNAVV